MYPRGDGWLDRTWTSPDPHCTQQAQLLFLPVLDWGLSSVRYGFSASPSAFFWRRIFIQISTWCQSLDSVLPIVKAMLAASQADALLGFFFFHQAMTTREAPDHFMVFVGTHVAFLLILVIVV